MGRGVESDEKLMLCYKNGDADAFEVLFRRHKNPLFRYLYRQVGDRSLTEELFQDVWMNLIRARERYVARAKFATLLYKIARNRVVDHYRSKKHADSLLEESVARDVEMAWPDSSPGLDRLLDAERKVARLKVLISRLPQDQREAYLLHEEAELSVDEIARTTGVRKETAKSRLRYAIAKLRAGMSGD